MPEGASPRRGPAAAFQALYVRVLLRLLPLLLSLFRHASPKIRAEIDYLAPGYTFMLSVNGTALSCACRRTEKGSFKRVPPARLARDVEPGSGLASTDPAAVTVDYVIAFRSLAYAFACFSGGHDAQAGAGATGLLHARPQRHGRGPHLYVHRAAEDVLRLARRLPHPEARHRMNAMSHRSNKGSEKR